MPLPVALSVALLYVPGIFSYGCKVWVCAKAASRSYEALNSSTEQTSQTQKTTTVFLNGATALAQGADIISDFIAPPPIQLGLKAIVAICDTSRVIHETCSKEEISLLDSVGCISVIALRGADFLHLHISQPGNAFSDQEKIAAEILKTTAVAAVTIKEVMKGPQSHASQATQSETQRESESQTESHGQSIFDKRMEFFSKQSDLHECKDFSFDISKESAIQDFHYIPFSPSVWNPDPILNLQDCPIQKAPIRFICVVKGPENTSRPVYYEKQAVLDWLEGKQPCGLPMQERTLLPPFWPADLPFERESIQQSPLMQQAIDKRLSFLLKLTTTKDSYHRSLLEVQQANTIKDFPFIPEMWDLDVVLNLYCCPIQQRPIRFICVVKGTESTNDPVYYEQSAILQWLEKNPTKYPSKWPQEVPFNYQSLMTWEPIQSFIDKRLSLLLEQTKEELGESVKKNPFNLVDNHQADSSIDLEYPSTIPPDFVCDEVLQQYICPIQKGPIHSICVVEGTELQSEPVYYDRVALLTWLKNNPRQRPPRWPEQSSTNICKIWKPIQKIIDTRLQYLSSSL